MKHVFLISVAGGSHFEVDYETKPHFADELVRKFKEEWDKAITSSPQVWRSPIVNIADDDWFVPTKNLADEATEMEKSIKYIIDSVNKALSAGTIDMGHSPLKEEECKCCKRTKDIGKKCWWCGGLP